MAEIGAEFYVISLQISNQDKTFSLQNLMENLPKLPHVMKLK